MHREVGAHRRAGELEVRLVDQDERVGGVEELCEELLVRELAGGVVRAGHDDVVDVALADALKHRLLVDRVIGEARNVDDLGAREARVGRVHRERRRQVQELASRPAPGERDVEQKLVAAVAQKHLVAVEPVRFGDHVAQIVGQWIGVTVQRNLANGADNLLADLSLHVARVLVRGKICPRRKVLRVVGHKPLELRGGLSHAIQRSHLHRLRSVCQRARCSAARRTSRAPTGPRGERSS